MSTEHRTAPNAKLSSSLSSESTLSDVIPSARLFNIAGNLRLIDALLIDARDDRALALKLVMGGERSVGMRFGKIMLARDVSVSRVNNADSAWSACAGSLRRLRRYGKIWSTAFFPNTFWKASKASAAASRTSASGSTIEVRRIDTRAASYSCKASGDAEEIISWRAIQIPCLRSVSAELCNPASSDGSKVAKMPSPAFLINSPKALPAMVLVSRLGLASRPIIIWVKVGTSSFSVRGVATKAFHTATAALLTKPKVSHRQIYSDDKTLFRRSSPRTSSRELPACVAPSPSSSSASDLFAMPVKLKRRSPTSSTELSRIL